MEFKSTKELIGYVAYHPNEPMKRHYIANSKAGALLMLKFRMGKQSQDISKDKQWMYSLGYSIRPVTGLIYGDEECRRIKKKSLGM